MTASDQRRSEGNGGQGTDAVQKTGVSGPLLFLIVVGCLGFGAGAVQFFGTKKSAAESAEAARQFEARERLVQAQTAKAQQEMALASAREQQVDFVRRSEAAMTKAEALEKLASDWDARVAKLRHDDEGKLIATNPDHVRQFVLLTSDQRPPQVDIAAMRQRIEILAEPIKSAIENGGAAAAPSDESKAMLAATTIRIQENADLYARAHKNLDALQASAKNNDATRATAALQDVIEAAQIEGNKALLDKVTAKVRGLEQEKADERAQAMIAAAAEKQKSEIEALKRQLASDVEHQKDLLRQEEERLASQRESESAAKKAEADAAKASQEQALRDKQAIADAAKEAQEAVVREKEAAAERLRLENAKKALREKAQRQDVQANLAPFITKGLWLGGKKTATTPGGMSLSAITAEGALEKTPKGAERLGEIASTTSHGDERPRWDHKWGTAQHLKKSPETLKKIFEVQDLLIELGPTLVELKLLEP